MATPTASQSQSANLNLCTPRKHSKDKDDSISMVRVIVRLRSFLPHEISASLPCVSVLDLPLESSSEVTVHLKDPYSSRNESYKLDSFYGQDDKNVRQIFEREVMPLIPAVLNGSNATVFAYGATGSGKTFTMQGTDELPGLMPMAASTILSMCKSMGRTVEISYYEIYMERCYNLLEVKTKEIGVLDDKDGHPHLKNLSKVPIHSMLEFQEALFSGMQRQKVAHTGLNDVSSRSHSVLVISVSRPCEDGPGNTMIGKLNLIDLAGNEDNRKTGNEGIRLLESTKINQSLFALSNVIYALNNKSSRVPYRESKLTRILQDSLGGTSHAVMVACLNPGEYEESVHTVCLAARSRRISNIVHSAQKPNTPTTQVDMEAKLQAWLESKGKTKSAYCSPSLTRTPRSISSVRKLNTFQSFGKSKERSDLTDEGAYKNKICKKLQVSMETIGRSSRELEAENIDNATTPMMKELTRKVLSPIKSNENMVNVSDKDEIRKGILDPMTPKQSVANDKTENTDTPLNKFKALSCNLKTTLAQEYINFLNTASKVELLQLKGIGEKMADYIFELRDTSPLKSLDDLEKIGLSSKQVGNMFGRTAKGLFN